MDFTQIGDVGAVENGGHPSRCSGRRSALSCWTWLRSSSTGCFRVSNRCSTGRSASACSGVHPKVSGGCTGGVRL